MDTVQYLPETTLRIAIEASAIGPNSDGIVRRAAGVIGKALSAASRDIAPNGLTHSKRVARVSG